MTEYVTGYCYNKLFRRWCSMTDGRYPRCKWSVGEVSKRLGISSDEAYTMLTMYSIMTDLPVSDPIIVDMILEDNPVYAYVGANQS